MAINPKITMSNVRIATNLYFAQSIENSGKAGLYLREDNTICLRQTGSCAALDGTGTLCGEELAPRLSYKIKGVLTETPIELPLNSNNNDCNMITETQGICYGGIVINKGKITIDKPSISDAFLNSIYYEIYASVQGYDPLNLSAENAVPTSSSSGENTPIAIKTRQTILKAQEPLYYNLKGEPLGAKKPSKAGVYIIRQNGTNKIIAVR